MAPMMGGFGPVDSSGKIQTHWYHSSASFTLIIHLVCYKLFSESNYWNKISIIAGVISLVVYYVLAVAASFPFMANIFQPQLNGLYTSMFSNPKFLIQVIVVPFICLIPDIALRQGKKIFFPNPTDKIMFL